MITQNLGYPRIGNDRELKKAVESYWSGKTGRDQLMRTTSEIKRKNWLLQKDSGIDLIPSNDFSLYDHVLDLSFALGVLPGRFRALKQDTSKSELDLYFALARGYQQDGLDITAMEMTKWFDTNYHYMVPEFTKNQEFSLVHTKALDEFNEAKQLGIITKPVLLGPVSYLLLGKEKETGFDRLDLLDNLLKAYGDMMSGLIGNGANWIQIDEPFLGLDLTTKHEKAFTKAYSWIKDRFPSANLILATYFSSLSDNSKLAASLPVEALHIDLVRAPGQLDSMLGLIGPDKKLSLGIVDGRNIWKNDFENSLRLIRKATERIGEDRVMIAPSCSLLHVPCDLDLETDEGVLKPEIKNWMAFAKQKLKEVSALRNLSTHSGEDSAVRLLKNNHAALQTRKDSALIHNPKVKEHLRQAERLADSHRKSFAERRKIQQKQLNLPPFPITTIGSFPQTSEVRSWRAKLKKKEITPDEYDRNIRLEIERVIRWQEEAGLDVLVHGEFERTDMVEYFGQMLEGFAFTRNGWVQSYGSRCVKPPVIFGDVNRPQPMTVAWTRYAQSLTKKPVKGMLTGPVTILKWSFVRNDQNLSETCYQIALAIRDEVLDLEKAGIHIIQIDEPGLREGLPLRKNEWNDYLDWAVKAFRISYAGVGDETQIHTHMCYAEFGDIIESITALDADVITIECSRSQMDSLGVFADHKYPNDIGPGIYDIHSPRIPSPSEMEGLLEKAARVIPKENIWVNPDCGLKTRQWVETREAIANMVSAARKMRG